MENGERMRIEEDPRIGHRRGAAAALAVRRFRVFTVHCSAQLPL